MKRRGEKDVKKERGREALTAARQNYLKQESEGDVENQISSNLNSGQKAESAVDQSAAASP